MKNRPSIQFERTSKGLVGSIHTPDTFIIAKGDSKRQIRKEIERTLREF